MKSRCHRCLAGVFIQWLALSAIPAVAASDSDAPMPAAPLSLGAMLEMSAAVSGEARSAAADADAALAAVDRARAAWWPTLDLLAQYTLRDHAVEAQAGDFTFPTAEQGSGQYALEAREVLWDGGRRRSAEEAARFRAEATRLGGLAAIQRAQLGALDAYLGAMELNGAAGVLVQRSEALEAHLAIARDLLDHGVVARNDVLATEVRVREIEDQLAAVADRRALAGQDLNRRLGRDPLDALTLPDSLPEAPRLARDREALVATVGDANAGVLAAAARVRAGESFRDLASRGGRPALFVGATHGYIENRFLVHQMFNAVIAGVQWNLFDGGARAADVRQASARVALADREHLEAARKAQVALDAAWRRWEQARRELATARENVAAASENLRLVEDQYGAGLARSGDVLDAETLLAQNRHDAVRLRYAAYRAQADLLVTAGLDLAEFYGGADAAPTTE